MGKRIHVLQVMGSLNRGGAESMIMNLFRAIDDTHIHFDFVTHGSPNDSFVEEIKKRGSKVFYCPRYTGRNHFGYSKWWDHFFAEHDEYNILHSHVRSTATIFLPKAKNKGLKTIVHSHSTSNGKGIRAVAKKMLQFPLRFESDFFFGCSKEASIWLFGKKIVEGNKYYLVPNAIDTSLYIPDEEIRQKYREQMGVNMDEKLIIHVGRFHESKNHEFMVDVIYEMIRRQEKVKLLFVGDGELRGKIESRVTELGIQEKVIFAGIRNDVPQLLISSDVYIMPSMWEGLPVSAIEAQAAGLPCFLSDQISQDVAITDLVVFLPINNGIDVWINAIEIGLNTKHKDEIEKIAKAGYDIRNSADWFETFYMGAVNL